VSFWGVTIYNSARALGALQGEFPWRFEDVTRVRISGCNLWINNRFLLDFGDGYKLNNKVSAGYEVVKGGSVFAERRDVTNVGTTYGVGLQLRI
jgi:hypothetical protein